MLNEIDVFFFFPPDICVKWLDWLYLCLCVCLSVSVRPLACLMSLSWRFCLCLYVCVCLLSFCRFHSFCRFARPLASLFVYVCQFLPFCHYVQFLCASSSFSLSDCLYIHPSMCGPVSPSTPICESVHPCLCVPVFFYIIIILLVFLSIPPVHTMCLPGYLFRYVCLSLISYHPVYVFLSGLLSVLLLVHVCVSVLYPSVRLSVSLFVRQLVNLSVPSPIRLFMFYVFEGVALSPFVFSLRFFFFKAVSQPLFLFSFYPSFFSCHWTRGPSV